MIVVAAATLLVALAALGVQWTTGWSPVGPALSAGAGSRVNEPRNPHHWQLDGRALRVYSADGSLLWTRDLGEEPNSADFEFRPDRKVVISDLDGDGTREVLFVLQTPQFLRGTALLALNADGSTRFEYRPTPTYRFGDTSYGPPWSMNAVFVTPDGPGEAVWAVSYHIPYFPSQLDRLDPKTGKVLSTYFSDGYIHDLARVEWRGRPVLAVVGLDNEWKGGSLAIFPADRVAGSAPAAKAHYRCRDCAPGGPSEFYVFPRSCLLEASGDQQGDSTFVASDGRTLKVAFAQALHREAASAGPAVVYDLAADGTLVRPDMSEQFISAHRRARQAGLIDHDLGPRDDRWLRAVLRWDGSEFVPLDASR